MCVCVCIYVWSGPFSFKMLQQFGLLLREHRTGDCACISEFEEAELILGLFNGNLVNLPNSSKGRRRFAEKCDLFS